MVPALMQRTEPTEACGIRWLCRSSRLIGAAGRHYARHAGRFCFWSSATRVRPQSPIGSDSLHTQSCGLRLLVCAPFGSHKTGTCLAQNFASGKKEQRVVIQAQLLCCPRTGRVGGHNSCGLSARYGLPPFRPFPSPVPPHPIASHRIPLHCGAARGSCINHSGCTRGPHSGKVL